MAHIFFRYFLASFYLRLRAFSSRASIPQDTPSHHQPSHQHLFGGKPFPRNTNLWYCQYLWYYLLTRPSIASLSCIGVAPCCVATKAPTRHARSKLADAVAPPNSESSNVAKNESPAPTVSTAVTSNPGCCATAPDDATSNAPSPPRVTHRLSHSKASRTAHAIAMTCAGSLPSSPSKPHQLYISGNSSSLSFRSQHCLACSTHIAGSMKGGLRLMSKTLFDATAAAAPIAARERASRCASDPYTTTAPVAAVTNCSVGSIASHALGCTMSYEGMEPSMVTTTNPVGVLVVST
mmetsp:Transcript_5205/g.17396  ORF Transcript_5205/g.17396 Transcript_5205/m.17396 type:complete len:293 (-) Transcript_5205:461-1339(-)